MILSLIISPLIFQEAAGPQPYGLAASSTAEGAKRTVSRLLAATEAGDDAGFDRIARGMVIMLAPDFGASASRAEFAEALKGCTDRRVESAVPFPKSPQAQSVRVTMQCRSEKHPQPAAVVADVMADDEHVFAMFPGGVSRIWPSPADKPSEP